MIFCVSKKNYLKSAILHNYYIYHNNFNMFIEIHQNILPVVEYVYVVFVF